MRKGLQGDMLNAIVLTNLGGAHPSGIMHYELIAKIEAMVFKAEAWADQMVTWLWFP
nr:hypothetical protein [Aeromonas veronii]